MIILAAGGRRKLAHLTETLPSSGRTKKAGHGRTVTYFNEAEVAARLRKTVREVRLLQEAGRLGEPLVAKTTRQRYFTEAQVDAFRLEESNRILQRDGLPLKPPADPKRLQNWFVRQLLAD